eukprot:8600590-Pyramimonas_sp.AAC.3
MTDVFVFARVDWLTALRCVQAVEYAHSCRGLWAGYPEALAVMLEVRNLHYLKMYLDGEITLAGENEEALALIQGCADVSSPLL